MKKSSGMIRKSNVVYASKDYVEDARLSQVTEYHYYYIPPMRRKGGVTWHIKRVVGLIHQFSTERR